MKKVSSKSNLQKFESKALTKKQKSKLKGGTDIVTTDVVIL